jgi:hypothetical protein
MVKTPKQAKQERMRRPAVVFPQKKVNCPEKRAHGGATMDYASFHPGPVLETTRASNACSCKASSCLTHLAVQPWCHQRAVSKEFSEFLIQFRVETKFSWHGISSDLYAAMEEYQVIEELSQETTQETK